MKNPIRWTAASLILLFLFVNSSCKDSPPAPPISPTISLTVEDVSCTEAWLKVTLTDASEPRTIAIEQDGQRILTASLTSTDSTFLVDSLLPRRSYSFAAARLRENTLSERTGAVQVTTMDTTSHEFIWQLDTLGDYGSSLQDIAIINDTLAYAAGAMYLRDSTGQIDPIPYNLAVWNGRAWKINRVSVQFRGNMVTLPLDGVYANSPTDIWLAGSIPIHGDGQSWVGYDILSLVDQRATVSRIWGTPAVMYFVGRSGNIIQYASNRWQRLESGTTLPILDIKGARNSRTGVLEILCVASDPEDPTVSEILRVNGGTVYSLPIPILQNHGLRGIWFEQGRSYFAVGDGLWQAHSPLDSWREEMHLPPLYRDAIDGQGINDVVVCGAYWLLAHWNGVSWRTYFSMTNGAFGSVAISQNQIVAVGDVGSLAIAAVGTRFQRKKGG